MRTALLVEQISLLSWQVSQLTRVLLGGHPGEPDMAED
jgi:hypothetical protein